MTNSIHVYAGTAGHSAWFSEDSGMSWTHPNSHSGLYLEARVWCFAKHQETRNTLYAGTDMGLFRWDEVAARWTHLPSPMQDIWSIVQDPGDPRILFAGTRPAALYRSVDAGATWTALPTHGIREFSEINMGPTRVTQILFDPFTPETIWASVEIGGLYRSTDRGNTWKLLDRGLVSADLHGVAVVRKPGDQPVILCTTNRGLHRSVDHGETWTFQPLASPWQYTRAIVPRLDHSGVVFLTNGDGPPGSTGKLLRSRDYGSTWEDARLPGRLNSTPWCVATDPSDPARLFCATNLGQVFASTDGGESWSRLPHEFGEVRTLAWRTLPAGTRQQAHSLALRTPQPA